MFIWKENKLQTYLFMFLCRMDCNQLHNLTWERLILQNMQIQCFLTVRVFFWGVVPLTIWRTETKKNSYQICDQSRQLIWVHTHTLTLAQSIPISKSWLNFGCHYLSSQICRRTVNPAGYLHSCKMCAVYMWHFFFEI